MDTEGEITIPGDDGLTGQRHIFQRKARTFKVLSILWIVPTLTSLFVLFYKLPSGTGFVDFVKQIRLEQWLSVLLILLHPAFIYMALHYRRTEIPVEYSPESPDPGDEEKNPS